MAGLTSAGSILGIATDDTTWATFNASVAFMDPLSFDATEKHAVVDVATMGRSGAAGLYHEDSVVESIVAGGTIKTHVGYQTGFLHFALLHCLGAVVNAGSAAPYTHTYPLGDMPALGMSLMENRGDDKSEKFSGGRVTSWSWTQEAGDASDPHAILEFAFIAKSSGGEVAQVSATYPPTLSGQRALASEVTGFTFNAVNYVSTGALRKFTVSVDRAVKPEQAVGSKYTGDPSQSGPLMVTVTATLRREDVTAYAAHIAQTQGDIVITYDGAATHDTATITARNAKISQIGLPYAAGTNDVMVDVTWKAYGDSADSPLTIAITNAASDPATN